MIKELQLRIKPEFQGAQAQKGLQTQSKLLRDQKKDLAELGKTQSKVLKDAAKGLKEVGDQAGKTGLSLKGVFSGAKGELEQFGKGVETLKSKLISLKSVIVGSAIGGLALAGIDKLLKGGQAEQKATGRINREFGADSGFIKDQAARVARLSGISREEVLKAFIPIGEATQGTQAGVSYRGRKLSAGQATALRRQTTGFGADLLARVATVTGASGEELNDLAQALAEGGSGPEGTRRFVSAVGGNRVFAREFNAANQKGQASQFLSQRGFSADRLKGLGINKGQVAGQGAVLDVIAQQAGITDEAAAAKRHSFGFQRQAIGASIDSTLGEIGAATLDKLTKSFGKGKTLAEKFQEALESDKGKKVIDGIANAMDRIVEGVISFAKELPKIVNLISSHKTLLEIGAGVFVGAKAFGVGKSVVSGARDVLGAFGIGGKGGIGKELAGALGSKPIPVYVVNAPAAVPGGDLAGKLGGAKGLLAKAGLVAGVGLAAYELGSLADKKFGFSTKIANALDRSSASKETAGIASNASRLSLSAANKSAFVKQLEATGLNHGQANAVAEHGGNVGFALPAAAQRMVQQMNVNPTFNIQLDGHTLATVTAPAVMDHVGRRLQTQTANGAAPGSRMP